MSDVLFEDADFNGSDSDRRSQCGAALLPHVGAAAVARSARGASNGFARSLSVVIPVYDEEANLPVLHERLTKVLAATEPQYEIVFVDDGSHDRSVEVMRGLAAGDAHVVVVELSRNFGHQVAISAGLDYARGEAVIIMDADLQDPPEVLPQFIAKWREGHDVVYAIRAQRKEGLVQTHLVCAVLPPAATDCQHRDSAGFRRLLPHESPRGGDPQRDAGAQSVCARDPQLGWARSDRVGV